MFITRGYWWEIKIGCLSKKLIEFHKTQNCVICNIWNCLSAVFAALCSFVELCVALCEDPLIVAVQQFAP